jgi:4-amino-4-deoxy-L-arabinose transferase-like glycosyltransferase
MFMRLLRGRARRPGETNCEWVEMTRVAAFVQEFNGSPAGLDSWADRFPRRLRWTLVLSLIGVTLVAIAVRAPLLGTAFTAPDTGQYVSVAQQVFHGGYSSNLRPPGYATLLAVFELFGGNPVDAAVILQNLIGMALPASVLLAGWRFFSPVVGVVASFLAAASPLMIAIEQFALSDYLFSVVLFAAVVVLAESVLRMRGGRSSWRLLMAAGALFGLATLFRVNGLFGLVAIPVALLIGGRPWKPAFRASGIAMAALVVVVAPWCIHNLIRFGDPSVASEGGISLYARVISYDQVPPSADTANGRLALSVYNAADPNEREAAVGTTIGVFEALVHQVGKDRIDAASAMSDLAREAILHYPGAYLRGTLQILGRYQGLYDPRTLTGKPNVDEIATTTGYIQALDRTRRGPPGGSALTRGPWQIAQALTQFLFIFTVGGLLILVLPLLGDRRSRLAASTFLTVGVLGIVGVSLTTRFELRHGIVFAPLIWILAPAAVLLAARLLVALLRRLPWPRTRHATS